MPKRTPDVPAPPNVVDHGALLRAKHTERRAELELAIADASACFDAYGIAAALATVGRGHQADADAKSDALDAANARVSKLRAEIAGLERLLTEHEREVEAKRRVQVHGEASAIAARITERLAAAESQVRAGVREWNAAQDEMRRVVPLLESIGANQTFDAFLTRGAGVGFGPPSNAELDWVRAFAWLVADVSGGRLPPPEAMRPPEWMIPPAFADRVASFFSSALAATDPALPTDTLEAA